MKVLVDGDYQGAPSELGPALIALESEFEAERPQAVVVGDDSEKALAAALVATKLLIPLEATAEATKAASPNGRVLAQLAAPPT